jgi:hypothetical protein
MQNKWDEIIITVSFVMWLAVLFWVLVVFEVAIILSLKQNSSDHKFQSWHSKREMLE